MAKVHDHSTKGGPIRLDFRNVDTPVLVRPDEADAFVVTMAEAVSACHQVEHAHHWKKEFDAFLAQLHRWSEEHSAVVAKAFITPSTNGLEVYLITKGEQYRPEFDDAVSNLDIDLARAFPNCPSHVMHLPDEGSDGLASFFNTGRALQVYGD